MFTRMVLRVLLMMCVPVYAGTAGGQDKVQNYFNDAACKVKATADPVQKREILDKSLQTMSETLDKVRSSLSYVWPMDGRVIRVRQHMCCAAERRG